MVDEIRKKFIQEKRIWIMKDRDHVKEKRREKDRVRKGIKITCGER